MEGRGRTVGRRGGRTAGGAASSSARSVVPPLDARCRMPPPLPNALSHPPCLGRILSHVPRVWGGSSLTSPGWGPDPLSHPPGGGRILSHVPRVGAGSSLMSPGFGVDPLSRPPVLGRMPAHFPGVGFAAGRVGHSGVRLVVAPLDARSGCHPFPKLFHVPRVWGGSSLASPVFGWRLGGVFLGALGRCSFGCALRMPPPFRRSLTSPGLRGGCCLDGGLPWCAWSFLSWARAAGCPRPDAVARSPGFGGCCVMGFTGVCFWCLGVFCGGGVAVFVVFSGFLGGVGVDLVWGWGACKVIRVAAADAEMMVTDSLQIAGFGGALVRFRVGVGGLGLVCFVRLVRVSLKSCSGAILDPGGCGWCR